MNKKLKGFICGLTALTMCVGLAGCNQQSATSDLPEGEYPGSEVVLNGDAVYPLKSDDTLTWWKGFGDGLGIGYENFGETPIAKKLEEETGVKIEYIHPTPGGENEQFQLMIASDELPDIVNYTWSNYPGGPQAAIDEGYIYSLNDLIDKYAPAFKKVLADKPNIDKQLKTDSGSYYTIPILLEPGILQITYGPVIRDDMLAKVSLEKPTTIGEWDTVLSKFKSELNLEFPIVGNATQISDAFAPAYDIYLDWYHDDGVVKYGYYEPAYKELLTQLNKWYEAGYITPDMSTLTSEQARTHILNDRAAATMAWAASGMGVMLTAGKAAGGEFSLAGTQYPTMEKGATPNYSYMTPEVSMYHGMAISKNCKNPELAMRYLDYGFTEKGHMIYAFGIEGESYNMEGDYPKYTDLIVNNPEGLKTSQAIGVYTMNGNAPFVQDERYIEQYYAQPELNAAQKEWLKSNMNSHMLPVLTIAPEEVDEDSNALSFIQTYIEEMRIKFIRGEEPIENFDAYIKQLEDFGIKEVIARRQAAYDRFESR